MATAPKRSLFKKPAWATTAASPSASNTEFYKHSDRVYEDIVADNERRRQRRSEKAALKEGSEQLDTHVRDAKRRRLSQDDVEDGRGSDDGKGSSKKDASAHKPRAEKSKPSGSRTGTRSQGPAEILEAPMSAGPSTLPTVPSVADTTIVPSVDGSDDEIVVTKVMNRQEKIAEEPSDSDSDEYVRELKRKAREKRRIQLLHGAPTAEASQTLHSPSDSQPKSFSFSYASGSATPRMDSQTPPPSEDDPVCRILITSPIAGTKPLIVERRASQRLREVRDFWCRRQGFDDAFSRTVFLTWRLHRLYDISTCKSLADKAKATITKSKSRSDFLDGDDLFSPSALESPLSPSSSSTASFLEKSKGKITVEAMTEEHFERAKHTQRQKDTTEDQQFASTTSTSHPHDTHTPDLFHNPTTTAAPKEPDIRILLRAQNLEPLKLKVRPSTPVWKVMAAFKDQRVRPTSTADGSDAVGQGGGGGGGVQGQHKQQVILVFDGEQLNPDDLVGATEIEDTDTVDVVIR